MIDILALIIVTAIAVSIASAWKASPPAECDLVGYDGKWLTAKKSVGDRQEICKFYGSCTVWHYPNGRRCSTLLECRLSELWTLAKIRSERHA